MKGYDQRWEEILTSAAGLFCAKGYDAASIRDLSRATGTSLAGLYYYFPSKEHLLYELQKDAFVTLIARASERLAAERDPVGRLRAVIASHLAYSLEEPARMKVLSREMDTLQGPRQSEIAALKRRYYKLCVGVVEQIRRAHRLHGLNSRLALMSLFGMMNWLYTWHNPQRDPAAENLSEQMAAIFLHGILQKETYERNRSNSGRKATGRVPRRAGHRGSGNGRSASQRLHL
jgi:AcrR family transcriptional regulator